MCVCLCVGLCVCVYMCVCVFVCAAAAASATYSIGKMLQKSLKFHSSAQNDAIDMNFLIKARFLIMVDEEHF